MFRLKEKIRYLYYLQIRHISDMDYNIMKMRESGIKIGEGCRIFSNIKSNEAYLIEIGDKVTISSDVKFCTHDNGIVKAIDDKTDILGRIVVGNNCFIGMNCIILGGVVLGKSCVVGAGSVVTNSFPDGCVIAGNPAKYICSINEYAEKNKDRAFNFRNMPNDDKRKQYVLSHEEQLVVRKRKQM